MKTYSVPVDFEDDSLIDEEESDDVNARLLRQTTMDNDRPTPGSSLTAADAAVTDIHNDDHCTYEEAIKRTAAECDLDLTSQRKGVLNSVIFLGMMFGNYIWGTLADVQGRKRILLYSLTLNAVANFASSFSQVYWLFLLLRFVSGIGVGGSLPVVFSYFVEFQPKSRRGSMVSALATFWMSGSMIAPGLAWAIIPHTTIGYFSSTFTYNSWRIFVAVCSLPSLSSAILFACMPESPKFLLMSGNDTEAIRILKRVHRVNNKTGSFSVSRIMQRDDLKVNIRGNDSSEDEIEDEFLLGRGGCREQCALAVKANIKEFLRSARLLFKPPLLRKTLILLTINLTLAFGFYGLWMWFPELFKRMKETGGSACGQTAFNHSHVPVNRTCDGGKDVAIFTEGFITAAANLPGNLFTICVMDYIGARILLAVSMVLSGISVFFIWFVNTETQGLIMSCIFSGISTIGWNSLDVISVESFPTSVRSSSIGLQSAIARLAAIAGNLAFGGLVDYYCIIPMLLVAALLTIGGISAFKLPKLTRQDID
ncbi:synaptic vesicle glycoprotein 2C-like isoform X2 [Tubulanus polymorphus]|uniref:synaptic vesicle glycoprotein 2C-like isoform X2 n=1 Tax=Tubulanus polymorphus TaxID=672921 RepID=UPI003DA3F1D7